MNAFLRKTVKGLRFIGIAVLVTTGLSNLTVLAAEGDVDSLLVIPAASFRRWRCNRKPWQAY